MSGMFRNKRENPTCDTAVTISRVLTNKRAAGVNPTVRMLLRSATGAAPNPPSDSPPSRAIPPSDRGSMPQNDGAGIWYGFWEVSSSNGRTEIADDPPRIDPPVIPSLAEPYVWMVEAEVKANSTWTRPELYAKMVFADRKDLSGAERVAGMEDVAMTTTSLYIPSASLTGMMDEGPAAFAKEWRAQVNRTRHRDIIAVQETQDRRWVRLVVEDRG